VETGDFRDSDPAAVLTRLAGLARSALDAVDTGPSTRLAGGGLALPGLVDSATGFVRVAPNLGWREVDVRHALADADVPVALTIGNEADLAARAEARARAGSGMTSVLDVSGEVGVGAAIVLDGELLRGRHGWSGELGHVVLGTTGGLEDGSILERLAGKDAITRTAGLRRSTSVAEIRRRADAGDVRVGAALAGAGDALGVALSVAANLVDVETVVLGGIYADLADHLVDPVLRQLRHRLISAPWVEPSVHVAVAGPYPAMTGAALGALDDVLADPTGWIEEAAAHSRLATRR
jgi:predicted NBD/HSP70 family sugar kinase